MTLTPDELSEIRARCEAATEGPYCVERHDMEDGSITYEIWTSSFKTRIVSINDELDNDNARLDAQFLANARADIPALLSTITTLATENECLAASCQAAADSYDTALHTIAALEQQLAEARADREVGARYVRMLVGSPAFHDSIGNALAWAEKGDAK